MRRDSIFYALFQQSPALLFELLESPPINAANYRFDSVAVKEPKFEIDGVFLPPDTEVPGVVFFCEVQFQKDEFLYERLFSESFLYFYRNRSRYSNWQAVVIYPSRTIEQSNSLPYSALLNSEQVNRVYLDELGEIQDLPLGVALMVLTLVEEEQAPETARYLLQRTQQENQAAPANRAIIEMITTIMVYKFTRLSRKEVEAMLGVSLKETRVYQEGKSEGRQEGRQEGRKEGEQALVIRQLTKRFGALPDSVQAQIQDCSLEQLEALSEALLDFQTLDELQTWF